MTKQDFECEGGCGSQTEKEIKQKIEELEKELKFVINRDTHHRKSFYYKQILLQKIEELKLLYIQTTNNTD